MTSDSSLPAAGGRGRPVRHEAAAVCTPGLEPWCRAELEALGLRPRPSGPGTLTFEASNRQLYAANLWLRTATRVVVRLATFRSTNLGHLERRVAEIDWDDWLGHGVAPEFRVTATDSKLYHTEAVAERFHRAAGPAVPDGSGDDVPRQRFVVRIARNTVTVSADASGTGLHHRSWRTESGIAPLRTTMAAAMVMIAGHDRTCSLVDPFCGSGTIVIEAALRALDRPPSPGRGFAFQRWPTFEPGAWSSVTGEAAARAATGLDDGVVLAGSDRDPAAVAAAEANAVRAGVSDVVSFETRVVSHLPAVAGRAAVVTNPPYGRRVGRSSLDGLYRRLGAVVRERAPEAGLTVLCADGRRAPLIDRRLRPVARFRHGGLGVQVFHREPPAPADAVPDADADATAPGG